MISLTACSSPEAKIHKRYQSLQSYTAAISVTVTGNQKSQEYEMIQSYRAPGQYRLEITKPDRMQGTVCVINGDSVWMRSAGSEAIWMEQGFFQEGKDYLFLPDFLAECYEGENLPPISQEQEEVALLHAPHRGEDEFRFTQCLEIDKGSYMPKALMTYHKDGGEVIRVTYRSFTFDAEIEDSVFQP